MKKLFFTAIVFFGLTLQAETIRLAVAANVAFAMDELIVEFNKTHPNVKIEPTFSSSGKLVAQIKNGAPYDIFMAANMAFPKEIYDSGLATTKPIIYAQGALAFFSSKEFDFSKGMELLTDPSIQKIAIANPKTAPYGAAAVEAFKSAKIYEKIENKLVFAESISQTVNFATTAADIGLINASALYSSKMSEYKEGKNWAMVEDSLYEPIDQGVVLLKGAKKEAESFYDFIFSNEAKKIMKEYGYLLP
ncbi:MAG: molybdate ABC transporter substrate-binding protein [Campylobacterales bacterium]|nr:molybdate ABC transporter substrate-binding protein [Campylobacterales bacterium]